MSAESSWDDLQSILKQAEQARAEQDEMRAHTLYVRATQLDPNNAMAWAGRAAMSFDPDDSIVAWGYALALKPHNEHTRSILGQRVQERISTGGTGDVPDLITLGRDLAEAGQKSFAHQLFVRVTELAENNSSVWVWRAGCADSTDEAVMCLHRALALDPANKKAQAGLQWVLSQKIAPPQFASPEMARKAARHVSEGQQLLSTGEKSRAHELFVRATELDHSNQAAWLWRASTTQDVDQALICVEQALRLNPRNEAALEAQKFLRARKLGIDPQPSAPAAEPVAPTLLPEVAPAPNPRTRILLLAILLVVLLLLLYGYLRAVGLVR